MEPYNLIFDANILALEQEDCWSEAATLAYRQWKLSPNLLNSLLCAGTELWYALLLATRNKENPHEFTQEKGLQDNLMEVTRWGLNYFADSVAFNGYFGYMIKVMPYFFPDYNGDYIGWETKGITMMRHSHEIDPTNPFAKAMLYEPDYYGKGTPFFEACSEIWANITPVQWGASAVQQYFFYILFGDVFFPNAYKNIEDNI